MKGRKPIPSKIKELRGNPGRRKLGDEAQPEAVVPDCPEFLDDEARREWNRIVPGLAHCGLITSLDRANLAGYCQFYSRWAKAELELAEERLTVSGQRGPSKHPLVNIIRESAAEMRAFAAEFGMSPSSRTRMATPSKGKADQLEDFLKIARPDFTNPKFG